MNNKNVLIFGRGAYNLLCDYVNFVANPLNDKKFLYENKTFKIVKNGLEEDIKLFDDSFINKKNIFDYKDLFSYLLENINFSKFSTSFSKYKFDIEEAYEKLSIEKILDQSKDKTIDKIFIKIKNQIAIFLSFLFSNKINQNNHSKKFSINFYMDEILKNFDDQFNLKFFEWIELQYKKLDFNLNRFNLLKEPIILKLSEQQNTLNFNKYEDKIIFSNDFNISKSELYEIYLKLEKIQLIKDVFYSEAKIYDDIYSSSEVNLFTNLKTISLSQLNFGEKFGKYFNSKNNINRYKHFDLNQYKQNWELIEYYPDLTNLSIVDDSNFDINAFNNIFKNNFLKTINFYLIDYENIDSFKEKVYFLQNKNSNIKINFLKAEEFVSRINKNYLESIKNNNNLKYDIIWNQPKKINHKIVYPIRLLKNIKGHLFNEIGGYVSNPFNLSQLGDCWIENKSLVLDNSRVIENVKITKTTIVRDNALILGNSKITNSVISKSSLIKDNSTIENSIVTDNSYISKNTKISGNLIKKYIPNIKNNTRISLDEGFIYGKVIFKNNSLIQGIVNLKNTNIKPMIFSGNCFLNGEVNIIGSVYIGDNANLLGKINLQDNVKIFGNTILNGEVFMYHNSKVYDNAKIGTSKTVITLSGNTKIYENAKIYSSSTFSNDSEVYGNNKIYAKLNLNGKTKFFANVHLKPLKNDITLRLDDFIFGTKWLKIIKKHKLYVDILESIYIENAERTNSKYVITNKTKKIWVPKLNKSVIVYRIQALQDFGDIKKNEFGGFVENINNLSSSGKCWIYDEAIVFGNAQVKENARIYNNVHVYDNAVIAQNAVVLDDVKIYNSARVMGKSLITKSAEIFDLSVVSAMSNISDFVKISGNSVIFDNSKIIDNSIIKDSKINGNSILKTNSFIKNSNLINSIVSSSKVKRSLIENSIIENNSTIINSTLGKVHIFNSSQIKNSFINYSTIENNSLISNSTIYWTNIANDTIVIKSLINWSSIKNSSQILESTIVNSIVGYFSLIDSSLIFDSKIFEFSKVNFSIIDFSKLSWISSLNNSKILTSVLNSISYANNSIIENSVLNNISTINDKHLKQYKK